MTAETGSSSMTVAELMSREVVTIPPDATMQQVIGTMVYHGIRHLPVVEDDRLVAIASDRNIRVMVTGGMGSDERRRYLTTTPVTAHATRPVTTIAPDATCAEAARMIVEQRIGCLPVVDDGGQLVGIVTQSDLLKWLAQITS